MKTLLYRAAKRSLDALPPQVLRARPFGVYAINLTESPAIPWNSSDADAFERDESFGWAHDRAAVERLAALSDGRNREAWDGDRRRVAYSTRANRPVGVAWIATGSFDEAELGLRFALAPDEAWVHSAVTATAERRRGAYTRLLRWLGAELHRDGCRRLLLGVSAGNVPSRRAHTRAGADRVGTILAVRCGGLGWARVGGDVRTATGGRVASGRLLRLRVGRPVTHAPERTSDP